MSEWGDKLLTESDNARLRAENDKLRVELTDLRLESCPRCGIKVENEELRKLVRDLARWYGAEHQPHEELRFWGDKSSGVYARMRELGIEVEQ